MKDRNKNGEGFRTLDYNSKIKSIKIIRKTIIDNSEQEKKGSNKYNKQAYKSLDRTMNTNIMDTDIPFAMKFRNHKALAKKVTIGPSQIHRNGLMSVLEYKTIK